MTKAEDYKITDPVEQLVDPRPINAPHPGAFIRETILAPLKLSVAGAAREMKINRSNFVSVLDGKTSVSRDLAYKLEALTGLDADLLIGMQAAYDRAQELSLRARYKREIKRVELPAEA